MKIKNDSFEVLLVKIMIWIMIVLISIILLIIAPKKVLSTHKSFELAVSMAIMEEDNLLLYDSKVYSNFTMFEEGLKNDVEDTLEAFIERNEIMAIRIYGNEEQMIDMKDHVYIISNETSEFTIEYYVVKDLKINGFSLPCRTFIMLYDDISEVINHIYLTSLILISVCVIFPSSIKVTRLLMRIQQISKNNNMY